MKTAVLVTLALTVMLVSGAPAPRPDALVAPLTPVVYSTPFSYSYSNFISHPGSPLYTPYVYPYSYAYGYPYYVV